jgi:hypothetical protein
VVKGFLFRHRTNGFAPSDVALDFGDRDEVAAGFLGDQVVGLGFFRLLVQIGFFGVLVQMTAPFFAASAKALR